MLREQQRIIRVMLMAAALLAGPAAHAAKVERAAAPEGAWSLGAADVYVEISEVDDKGELVSFPVTHEEIRWLEANTLRLSWWNPLQKRFEPVASSGYDSKYKQMQGTVSKNGRYGVFGFSRWSHVQGLQQRICLEGPLHQLSNELIDRLCLVILCPAFDAGAWSQAWMEGTGESVPPGEVRQYFENICDRCLGHPTAEEVEPAECEGDVTPVGGSAEPPEVEQIPMGIEPGGRAVSIAVHPADETMIVASETGGLFKTEDGGINWRHISYDTVFDFTDVQYLPANPDVVVASAERDTRVQSGGGIWRSADGGETWTQMTLTPPLASCAAELGARALDYEPVDDRLWAGTSCGLAYSADGGQTWSYMPAATGYNHDKVWAVEVPAPGNIKILTNSGVKVTTNGGTSWSVSTTGLPAAIGLIGKNMHNELAVSPRDPDHLYWSFAYWGPASGRWGLYRSTNNGASWSMLLDEQGLNRPPFVRVAEPLSGNSNQYDLYVGNGACALRRTTVTHGPAPTFSPWTTLNVDHCDTSDVAFRDNGSTPWLLASDGGLHKTADNGLNWTLTGGGGHGYNALQITEVIGQQHELGGLADLYFATQDNYIWASPDQGRTWPGQACCEGFYLNVPREPLPEADTRFNAVACGPCINFIAGRLLSWTDYFPGPPDGDNAPTLLKPETYVHNTRPPATIDNLFNLTTDTGVSWMQRYGFPEPLQDVSRRAGPASSPVVLVAFKLPGTTPDGAPKVGIKRITDVLGAGAPVVSEVGGFGSLGTFPTAFAWYKPFGVDPGDPSFFLVPDILDQAMKVSIDGGMSWTPDNALTALLTGAGEFRFRWREFVQLGTLGFDPECPGHILAGSTQAGIFRSFDGGGSWARIDGTEVIPRVSSFYFADNGQVIVSSYGRGLWRVRYTCPPSGPTIRDFKPFPEIAVYRDQTLFRLKAIEDPAACPACIFALAQGGEILEVLMPEGGVTQAVISGGKLVGYSSDGKEIGLPLEVSTGKDRKLPADDRLDALLAAGNRVKGLYLEGNQLKGFLISSVEVGPEQLPAKKTLGPYIVLDLPMYGVGVGSRKSFLVTGYGFDPRYAVKLTLDGAVLGQKAVFDQDGVFRVTLPATQHVGGHILTAEQKTAAGTLRDVYSFNVSVQDSREE